MYLCKNSTGKKKKEEGIKEGEGDRKNRMQRKDEVYILEEDTPRNRRKY